MLCYCKEMDVVLDAWNHFEFSKWKVTAGMMVSQMYSYFQLMDDVQDAWNQFIIQRMVFKMYYQLVIQYDVLYEWLQLTDIGNA